MSDVRIVAAGDAALLVQFPSQIDPAINARGVALAGEIRNGGVPDVRDVVVGYSSVTVYFDPLTTDPAALEDRVRQCIDRLHEPAAAGGVSIDVPVCYGDELGPDLADVAASIGLSEADVIELHSAPVYRVYVVGFVPGFAYMARVDPRLSLPRRSSPRTRVPAGSVAIAAGQTGIYPLETPGGWHLLGRTRVKPYDPSREPPFLFRPGDLVRFRAITRAEFEAAG
jgi:KipI family sensor histidine kinase inhibitor